MRNDECVSGLENIISKNSFMSLIFIRNEDFVYEERVQLNCFYCSRYNTKWTCPPKIPPINYKKIISEYNNLYILKYERNFQKEDFDVVRNESTNAIHRTLLQMEKFLYINNNSLAISFIGGSCKLCKNGCGKERCNNPGMARIPLEATGVNVIKTLENIGIKVQFPIKDRFYRYGLIAW
ncbi:DUF2284 domain-containing protein [Phascolarctobacterium faecium]|uniref:DUF2284 domain-containing protein n=1 Tax=Phascolarctobacterium faecium TaxID=33025 RepID=UPI0032BFCCA9